MKKLITLLVTVLTILTAYSHLSKADELSIKVIGWMGPPPSTLPLVALVSGDNTFIKGRNCGDLIQKAIENNLEVDWSKVKIPDQNTDPVLKMESPLYRDANDCLVKNLDARSKLAKGNYSIERIGWMGPVSSGTPLFYLKRASVKVDSAVNCKDLVQELVTAERNGATVNWGTLLEIKSFHTENDSDSELFNSCANPINEVIKAK